MDIDDDESIFITQNTFQQEESDVDDSDDIVSNFVLKSDLYSDISSADNDEELVMAANNAENDGQQKEINNNKSGRFVYPKTDDDIKQLVQKEIPKSTKNKTEWAVKLFENWLEHRNEIAKTDNEISKIEGRLVTMTNDQLNTVLGYFITEVRNKKGLEYYPNTLYELIICIQRFLRQNDRSISILDDRDFSALRSVLDSKMKELSRNGIGLKTKKADVISADQETYMWSNNILGTDTPKKLCDTLLYCIGLNFALRAGQEHRNLRVGTNSQISLKISPTDGRKYLEYTEDVSKTNCGGLEHRKIQSKVVRAYQNTDCPERCIINMYQKYMSLRPNEGKCQAFYLRSKKYPTSDEWYDDCPIGVHQLQKTVSDLCKGAQFSGNFTNHSLRATAATRLYAAGVDEQLISEKTGHRSSAVRGYKRTCEDQLIMVDSVVNAKVHKTQDSTLTKSIVDKVDVKGDDPKNENGREISIDAGSVKINLKF